MAALQQVMGPASALGSLERFSGRDFYAWKTKARMAFSAMGLWGVVSGKEKAPERPGGSEAASLLAFEAKHSENSCSSRSDHLAS